MSSSDDVRLDHVGRRLEMVRAQWGRARDAAREQRPDGLGAATYDSSARRSTTSGSVVESQALRTDAAADAERLLGDALVRLEMAVSTALSLTQRLAPPAARNAPDGRVVVDCGNPYGCPTNSVASRQGLCGSCWAFADSNGEHRRASDVAKAEERKRNGTRERVAKHRRGHVIVDGGRGKEGAK